MNAEKIKKIKKGLKYCYITNLRECDSCPYGDLEHCQHDLLMKDTLKLIKEQEKEIEDLKEKNENLYELGSHSNDHMIGQMREIERLGDIIQRQQGEIDTLRKAKVIYETVDYCYGDLVEAQKEIESLKKDRNENKRLRTKIGELNSVIEILKDFYGVPKCKANTESCTGYSRGRCVSIENCMHKGD